MNKEWEKYLNLLQDGAVEVGWFPEDKYSDGTPVGGIAGVHEYGSIKMNIPPRPFMRPTVHTRENRWRDTFLKLLRQKKNVKQALQIVGDVMRGDIQEYIIKLKEPELSEDYVAQKRRQYPTNAENLLRASGHMVRSIRQKINMDLD